jgi:hypothetical protein
MLVDRSTRSRSAPLRPSDATAATDVRPNRGHPFQHETRLIKAQDIDVLRAVTMARKRREDPAPRVRLPGLGGKPFRKQVLGETSTRSGQVKCGNLLGTLQRADHVKLGGVAPLNRHNSLFRVHSVSTMRLCSSGWTRIRGNAGRRGRLRRIDYGFTATLLSTGWRSGTTELRCYRLFTE